MLSIDKQIDLILDTLKAKGCPIKNVAIISDGVLEGRHEIYYNKESNQAEIETIQKFLRPITISCMKEITENKHFILNIILKDQDANVQPWRQSIPS